MAPRPSHSSDELLVRSLQRIAEAVEAIRWLLIVISLLLLGVIAANLLAVY